MIILKKRANLFFQATQSTLENLTVITGQNLCENAVIDIAGAGGLLPAIPPFECHPYLEMMPLQLWSKYFVGTFPPISYLLDNQALVGGGVLTLTKPGGETIWPPNLPFYHGNKLTLWKTLMTPAQYNALLGLPRDLRKQFVIDFLTELTLNYSDVIRHTQRTGNYNANDSDLFNIAINNELLDHTFRNPQATWLIFNSSSTFGAQGLSVHVNNNNAAQPGRVNVRSAQAFDLFVRAWQERGATVYLRISPNADWIEIAYTNAAVLANTFRNKVCFEMKVVIGSSDDDLEGDKCFTIITPPSISPQTNRALPRNKNFQMWRTKNPKATATDFIREIYQATLSSEIETLYSFNF